MAQPAYLVPVDLQVATDAQPGTSLSFSTGELHGYVSGMTRTLCALELGIARQLRRHVATCDVRARGCTPNRSPNMSQKSRRQIVAATMTAAGLFVAGCSGEPSARETTEPRASTTSVTASERPSESDPTSTASAATSSSSAGSARGLAITTAVSDFGPMLFDQTGQAIYLFDKETTRRPACYGECSRATSSASSVSNSGLLTGSTFTDVTGS